MAGVIWGSTDFESTYSFVVERDGFIINGPEPIHQYEQVPGEDGAEILGTYLAPPNITLRGIISGTSNDDLQTKLRALINELCGSWAPHPNAGTGYNAPARPGKDLTIPKFGPAASLRKFPKCSYNGYSVDKFVQPRYLTVAVQVTVKFIQSRPEATAA